MARLWIVAVAVLAFACSNSETTSEADHTATAVDTPANTTTETEPEVEPADTTGEEPVIEEEEPLSVTPDAQDSDNAISIAYINSNEILLKLPSIQQADQQVQEFAKVLEGELKRKQQELQEKYMRYMQDTTASEAIMQVRAQELDQLQASIQELQYNSEQQLAQKKQELYEPILAEVDRAINAVARDRGFTHVFDAANGGLVYSEPRFNATPLVLAKLGVR
mgnify:CR=1 FL=1